MNNVRVRNLPFPFSRAIAFCSDCDSPHYGIDIRINELIREEYRLPIADSFFPKWVIHNRKQRGIVDDRQEKILGQTPKWCDKNKDWLDAFDDGIFDTVHGWIPRFALLITDDVKLGTGSKKSFWDHLTPPEEVPDKVERSFRRPEGWQQFEPPRFLLIRETPDLCEREIEIEVSALSDTISCFTTKDGSGKSVYGGYRAWEFPELTRLKPDEVSSIRVTFELKGSGPPVRLEQIILTSDLRETIEADLNLLKEMGVQTSVYTSHGGGYHIGRKGAFVGDSANELIYAELKENPQYALDLLRDYGIDFFNTASNTAIEQSKPIEEVVFPKKLRGGEIVYDFYRYFQSIPEKNTSLANHFGFLIESFLDKAPAGHAGLIYTHLYVDESRRKQDQNAFFEDPLDPHSKDQLERLSRLYHDESLPDHERVWVTTTAKLVRYSQVIQSIEDHLSYDSDSNTLVLESWVDEVTKRQHPFDDFSDLAGVTFVAPTDDLPKLKVGNNSISLRMAEKSDLPLEIPSFLPSS